jgi:hypothetical protein
MLKIAGQYIEMNSGWNDKIIMLKHTLSVRSRSTPKALVNCAFPSASIITLSPAPALYQGQRDTIRASKIPYKTCFHILHMEPKTRHLFKNFNQPACCQMDFKEETYFRQENRCFTFPQASMTKASLTETHTMLSTPLLLISSAFSMNPGKCFRLQVGVKAPGTAKRTSFFPEK